MKRTTFHVAVAVAAFAVAGIVPAVLAQGEGPIDVNIPFSFRVDRTTLPAGEYVVTSTESDEFGPMTLTSKDGRESVDFLTEPSDVTMPVSKSELVFHELDGKDYLAEVRVEGLMEFHELTEPAAEVQAENAGRTIGHRSVAAHRVEKG